jgi:hypothetical protein
MRNLCWAVLLVSLVGCQTPGSITDTAAIVSKLTVQLNGSVADYVSAANTERARDEQRLVLDQQQSARKAAANADQFQILSFAGDDRARTLLTALRAPVEPYTIASPAAASQADLQTLAKQLGKNTFDTGPLTQIATTTGTLAKPLDKGDQLNALLSFSQVVYGDLKTLNAGTAAKATAPVTAPPAAAQPPATPQP